MSNVFNFEIPLSRLILGRITVMLEDGNSAQTFFFFFKTLQNIHSRYNHAAASIQTIKLGGSISFSILKALDLPNTRKQTML